MLKNIIYIGGSVLVFFSGLVVYGIILNTREEPLSELLKRYEIKSISSVKLVVHRNDYDLDLFIDSIKVKTYKSVFGRNNSHIKRSKDDFVTPLGEYFICDIDSNTNYYKFLHLNYPSEKDAVEALRRGIITTKEFKEIVEAYKNGDCPPADTELGSNIGIHGIGKYDLIFRNLPFAFNWTNGSIAVSNEDMDELVKVVKIGTPVIIRN